MRRELGGTKRGDSDLESGARLLNIAKPLVCALFELAIRFAKSFKF